MRNLGGNNFIFLFFIIIMAVRSITSSAYSSPIEWVIDTLLFLPGIIIGITFHEFMHAYTAYKLGDQLPKRQGRVTLNPLKHIDPVGLILLILVHFGWGRAVMVNPRGFRGNRRLAGLLVAVAGVAMNFVIAFLCTGLYFMSQSQILDAILFNTIWINLVLMIFNLLPIPPLDGFGIITEIFDLRRFSWHSGFYNYGSIILLVLLMFGAIGAILTPGIEAILGPFATFWRGVIL